MATNPPQYATPYGAQNPPVFNPYGGGPIPGTTGIPNQGPPGGLVAGLMGSASGYDPNTGIYGFNPYAPHDDTPDITVHPPAGSGQQPDAPVDWDYGGAGPDYPIGYSPGPDFEDTNPQPNLGPSQPLSPGTNGGASGGSGGSGGGGYQDAGGPFFPGSPYSPGGPVTGMGPPIYPGGGTSGGAAGGGGVSGGGGTLTRGNPTIPGVGGATDPTGGVGGFNPPGWTDPTLPGGPGGGGAGGGGIGSGSNPTTPPWAGAGGTTSSGGTTGSGASGTGAGATANPLVNNLANSFQSAQDQANAANQDRLNAGMQMYADRMNQVLTSLGQMTNQDYTDAANRLQQDKAQSDQDLINRGLGNTTARPNAQRGLISDYNANLNHIRDTRLGMQMDAQSNLSKDAIDFMERATQQGPDSSFLAQLAQMIGLNGPGGTATGSSSGSSSGGSQTVNTPNGPTQVPSNPTPGQTVNVPGVGNVPVISASGVNLERPNPNYVPPSTDTQSNSPTAASGGSAGASSGANPTGTASSAPATPGANYADLMNSILAGGGSRPPAATPAPSGGSPSGGIGAPAPGNLRMPWDPPQGPLTNDMGASSAARNLALMAQSDPQGAARLYQQYADAGVLPPTNPYGTPTSSPGNAQPLTGTAAIPLGTALSVNPGYTGPGATAPVSWDAGAVPRSALFNYATPATPTGSNPIDNVPAPNPAEYGMGSGIASAGPGLTVYVPGLGNVPQSVAQQYGYNPAAPSASPMNNQSGTAQAYLDLLKQLQQAA